MKRIFSLVFLIIVVISILLTGCAQAAVTASGQNSDSAKSNTAQKPVTQGNTAAAISAPQNTPDNKPVYTAPAVQTDSPPLVKISDILQNHKTYDGKTVIIQGKIVNECGSGCWFTLKEGNAVIYIDLAPNNMVIPQKRGADARVTAKVVSEGSDVYLIGSKVEF